MHERVGGQFQSLPVIGQPSRWPEESHCGGVRPLPSNILAFPLERVRPLADVAPELLLAPTSMIPKTTEFENPEECACEKAGMKREDSIAQREGPG